MMQIRLVVSVIILFCTSVIAVAQESASLDKSIGGLVKDEQVLSLINNHIQYNVLKKGVDGYRVQIFFDSGNNSREKALSLRSEFMSKFPNTNAYVIWQQPNYKVRVGNCLTRIEAQKILDEVKPTYINAYIVKDVIEYPTFIAKDTIQ